jgi:hypothetical protein
MVFILDYNVFVTFNSVEYIVCYICCFIIFTVSVRRTATEVGKVQKERGVSSTHKTLQKSVPESSRNLFVMVYRGDDGYCVSRNSCI